MASIEAVLAGLDPPLKHETHMEEGLLNLTLIDPSVPAQVMRSLAPHEYKDSTTFRLLVLYAVNEIRGKGSHAPLEVMPAMEWDSHT
ncbi:hypothetical protein [Pseudomonas sp. CFBP 13719]|jgi:hypothetical protein|uniref:hypothetical protein n=1 Tax=Pseudomonas sp. CFBP 13719 TaxID=2775303 RepID=UPI00177D2CE4|nr:hypothetical protein [Pseudomonas sp. CFBP 13719]MBD8682927.1 hypothetical protein [Pseudomonas sp. CFBP 13719]